MEYHYLLSYVLIVGALLYSYHKQMGIEKQIFVNTLRAFVQLVALGLFLGFIFALESWWYYLLVLSVMLLFAAYTAYKRVGYFLPSLLSISFSSVVVLATLLLLGVVSTKPNELIPVGGMIVGNGLNIFTLSIDRYKAEIQNNQNTLEQYIALGLTEEQALLDTRKSAVRASLIPIFNTLQTVGIIHIPGIMSGMLIAGADPLDAVMYQVVIMYMMVAVALLTGLSATALLSKKLLRF